MVPPRRSDKASDFSPGIGTYILLFEIREPGQLLATDNSVLYARNYVMYYVDTMGVNISIEISLYLVLSNESIMVRMLLKGFVKTCKLCFIHSIHC